MPVVSNIKLKLLGVVELNFCIRVVCLLTASLMATHALSQDMSGWSDKTVCRLLLSTPDEPAYVEESTSRSLSCVSAQKVIKWTSSQTKFYTSFDKAPDYFVPHRNNTTSKAASFEDGALKLTIEPGMYGAGGQKHGDKAGGKERAELARKIPFSHKVKMSFRFRVADDFQATAWTMIAQIKLDHSSPLSPSVSVYADRRGSVKCMDYTKYSYSEKRPSKSIKSGFYPYLSDGDWHEVVINYTPSHTNGYCSVDVDGINQIEVEGYDSIPTPTPGKSLDMYLARIGIYRKAQPFSQTVYYDDWSIEAFPIINEN